MEPPAFPASGLLTVRAAPGSDATLVLPLPTGTPPFNYQWSRAGASLDERFTASDDAGGVRLTVSAARTGDTNVYTLQASNAAGSDTSRLRLEVCADEAPTGEDPPTFLRRLQDLTVKVGTRTRFLVEIVSSTECKVTWFRNERRLLEAERVALARDGNFWCADVAAISVDDAGRWTCTAENAGGRASCSAHLNVLVPKAYKRPEFVEELRALLTEQGTVSLECKVVGVPTPVLRWFKDSREIKAGDVFALTANAEDPTSLGTYTCEAVNCMGRAYSSSKVHVVGRGSREGSARPSSSSVTPEPPPIFTKELEDQFVRICEPLTLGCHIVVPPWPRNVVWYNKEGKIEPSERYHVLEDGAGGYLLEVGSAEWPDEGEWKCVATSTGGRIGISTCYVTMDVPKNYRKPRFMENLQAVLTEEGLVSFECKVVGFPTPVLSWFKDGQELKPGDVYQLTGTNSLGSYCCIARNCMGQASSSAELTVEDIQNQLNEEEKLQLFSKNQAPKFIQGLKSVEAKIDEPFRFTVKVAIPPEPSVLWYRDDQPVDESSRCHLGREERGVCYLDIQSLEFLDQAEWKCVAMNDFGHSVTSCFLKLIIPRHYKKPRFLENLQAILSDEGAVNLECKVIGVPQPILKWYKDGEELKPGDIHRIISGQDGTCCLGTYTCEAQNCMGIAASSASLLGFDDSMKAKKKKAEEQALQRNLSLSTIHEERTSQMYDTPVGDVTTLDDKGEISFSFDGKEVSVSLYETPDLTEEEALQIVEMYADQLSENITEHNVVELPPLRFVKETSTSGNLLMEAVIIDVSPEYFVSPDEDMRTEADLEDLSIADENGPPQLSLDQDFEITGEDYLEKTMALLSEERSDIKLSRKKSDSQKSADDFFSLSRDQSLSEEKRDDDTQAISDLQSFASAHSSSKPKSKSTKPSGEEGQESSEPTKTILFKDEALKHLDTEPAPIVKPKRERRTSRSSRRSSSGSEKSVSRSKEEALRKKESFEMEMPMKPKMTDEEFKIQMINISTSLSKVINDVQIIERDIILKSELMSSAATASRSLEIIGSLISPLSEIHSIADAAKESASESKEVSSTLFNSLPQPLKALQQSLTIIEKCIDMESDSKTLVKKTCVAFVETCGSEMQKLISDINSVTSKDYLLLEDRVLTEIESLNNEMSTVIKFSADTIKARNLLSEASEIKVEEPSLEVKHLRDTQKAVFELKSPLMSLLCIAECADSGQIIDVAKVRNSEVILNDMSASIQDLQTALEQIETLSVKESTAPLHKYNTEIIETVMESVVKLRSSFEQLSTESEKEDEVVLKQAVTSIKENLYKISTQIEVIEKSVGTFDVLQSENKLDALQKMAQILIALENNLPRLEPMPEIKNHMTVFHKNLTKVLENVIESNESKKYFTLMEICDAVNRINASIKNLDVDNMMSLASLNNTLRIIQDQFITNVFDSELNCSLLTNIADTLVDIQEAINTAEEVSIHVDSEHIQPITPHEYDEMKAQVVLEHIDHAIAAIENVKAIESIQDFKTSIAPTLENICPVLEELKRSVASIKASGVDEEHISELSDVSSFAQTFASPLCELNQNIIVLNQQIVENLESLKQNSEVMTTIAEPIHELHTTLQILQQDVISQYGEDLTPYDVSVNMASAVQNLQSCILMIQEQAGVEAADDMSTLEDISGIKTTADTVPTDRLVLPAAEETAVEQAISPFNQELQTTATAQALQTLHEHITVLQNPEIIDALDTLSEVSDYSSLKSFVIGLGELHSGIEEVLHPLVIEGSNEIANLINPSKLTAIAEPMQELQQSLSVLDTSNIPIYENLLEMPTERIHSVIQSVSEFKEHLDKCMLAVFPAMHTAENTVEIANKVGALREVCEHLKDIIETAKIVENIPVPEEVKALERTVDNLLDATDISKGIKIEQVKIITEDLYVKVATVQEEMLQFTPQTSEKLSQEAKLIQTIDEVQSNIAVLEQYDFVDLSRASDLTCTTPQIAVEIESDSLMLMENIVDSAVNVVQDSTNDMPMADLMIVEDFFKTCKNEFTILRCLISKATTHKKIIRLLQEFNSLQSTINEFKMKKLELKLSDDVNGCLMTFLLHADDCLQNVQSSLIKIVDSQAELLIVTPLEKFENSAQVLKSLKETKHDEKIYETVDKFVAILETAKFSLQNVQADIIEDIRSAKPHVIEDNTLSNMIEEFATFIEEVKMQKIDDVTKDMLEKVSTVIEKHHDFKDASGTGKTLILLKCLSDCTDVLQESLLEIKIPKQKLEEGPLKAVLTEMLEPLQALHSQLTNVQEQVLRGVDEDSISVDITTTESLVQTMTEKHKEIMERMETEEAIANEEISLIMEVDKEIHSIQDSLRSIENVQVALVVKDIAKPVEDIEKSMQGILSSEKANIYSEDKLPKEKAKQIIQHIDQYIELIEIVEEISAIIKIDDVKETMDIAKELRESIAASEIIAEGEESLERVKEVRKEQNRLALKLHTALSALQVQVFDSVQELAPALSTEVIQRIAQVTAQLQADLVAVTGIRVALQAPVEPLTETLKKIENVEGQAAITSPESVTVAVGSEAIILEQIGVVEQVSPSEQLIVTTEIKEKSIAETKETVTVDDANLVPSETIVESIHTETEATLAIEGTEAVVMEQTEETQDTKTTSKEDVASSLVEEDQVQEVASVEKLKLESESAVVIEDFGPVLHEVTVDKQQVDVGISQAELQEAPKATIEMLVLHIDQFISDDVAEVINELANVINAEELKQSISIAKEMRENIAASEVELKAETSDVLKEELNEQHAQLAHQLHTALEALENLSFDNLADIPSIDKNTLQQVSEITENLRADLVEVKTTPKLFDQLKDVKLKKVSDADKTAKQLQTKTVEVASVEPTVSEGKEIVLTEVLRAEEDTEVQKLKLEADTVDLLETTQLPLELAEAESFELGTKVGEVVAITKEDEPIILEEVIVSDVKAVVTQQAVQKSEKSLQEATTETLLQNINEFLSENIIQTVDKISAIANVDDLKDSLAVASELRRRIKTAIDNNTTIISEAYCEQLQQLQNSLSTVQTLALESTHKLKQVIEHEALEQFANTSKHLSLVLAAAMSQVHTQQETFAETEDVSVENSQKTDKTIVTSKETGIPEQDKSLSKYLEADSLQAKTIELPIVENVISSDVTNIIDQEITEEVLELISEDSALEFNESGVKEKLEQHIIETADATASIENEPQITAEMITITEKDLLQPLEQADESIQQAVLLAEEKLIISQVESASDVVEETCLPELEVKMKPIIESLETTQVAPAVQLSENVLQSLATDTEEQVQSVSESIEIKNQEKASSDVETDVLSKTESLIQIVNESVSPDVVVEEEILLELDKIAFEEATLKRISNDDNAVTIINAAEDTVQEMPSTVSTINEFAHEVVNTAILTAEEAIQPLVLEKEEFYDSQISSKETDVTKVEITEHKYVETSSPIIEDQLKAIDALGIDSKYDDVKETEEISLDLVTQAENTETVFSVDQSVIECTKVDDLEVKTMPLKQQKLEVCGDEQSLGEVMEIKSDEMEKEEVIKAKAIKDAPPISENIDCIPATTTEEINGLEQNIAVNVTCINVEEAMPLNQKETTSKSVKQELKVIETETELVPESYEKTVDTDVVEPQPLEQNAAISDTHVTEQSVTKCTETTACIDLEETIPLDQNKTASESVERELKVVKTETQLIPESFETNVATDIVDSQPLKQDIAVTDAITDIEETRPLHEEELASKIAEKSNEPELKIQTEIQLVTENIERTGTPLEQDIIIIDSLITEQPVALAKEITSVIDVKEIRPLQQDETESVHLEPEVFESKLESESVQVAANTEIVEPQSVEQINVASTLSVETALTEIAQLTIGIESAVMIPLDQEKLVMSIEQTKISDTENVVASVATEEVQVKQSEQDKMICDYHTPKTQNENIVLSLKVNEQVEIPKPVSETEIFEDAQMVEQKTVEIGLPSEETAPHLTETKKIALEQGGFIRHIDEFISDEISQLVGVITELTNSQELNASVEMAKVLKESMEFVEVAEDPGLLEEAKVEQAKLTQKLQDALSMLHTKALESAEDITPVLKPEALQRVSEIITHLQEDLEKAVVSGVPLVLKTAQIDEMPKVEENSMKQLEALLQEVTDKINLPTVREDEDNEALRDALDEVQTVIIKLKRDYDGTANDTLNETLEDLECSVRSVQLQINEDSPPELLQEACATLQLLVNNMSETHEVKVAETLSIEVKNENILDKCSSEADEAVKLLEQASKINIKEGNLVSIVASLSTLKDTIKTLKLSFADSADILIEKGVDVLLILDQLEDKVFTLEKDLAEVSLSTEIRDQILTAVHSVYGSISNMRGTISSIQKIYMFENYGKPSETLLRSIKNISVILEMNESDQQHWKVFKKSLRKVLNHFEDIKFYINLDKTARLPSDAAFTKIILEELKSNICEIMVPQASMLGSEAIEKVENLLECVNKCLTNIETKSSLEVKEKIPIFKELTSQIFDVTDFIKTKIVELFEANKQHKIDQLPEILEQQVIPTVEIETIALDTSSSEENRKTVDKIDDFNETVQKTDQIIELKNTEETISALPSTSKTADKEKKKKVKKQVMIQEIDIKTEIKQIASELIEEIAAQAIAAVENLKDVDFPSSETLQPEAITEFIEVKDQKESESSEMIEQTDEKSDSVPEENQSSAAIKSDDSEKGEPTASVSSKDEKLIEEEKQETSGSEQLEKESLDTVVKEQQSFEVSEIHGTENMQVVNEEDIKKSTTETLEVTEDSSKEKQKQEKKSKKKKDTKEQGKGTEENLEEDTKLKKQTSGGVSGPSTSKKQDMEKTPSQELDNEMEEAKKDSEIEEKQNDGKGNLIEGKEISDEEANQLKEKDQKEEIKQDLENIQDASKLHQEEKPEKEFENQHQELSQMAIEQKLTKEEIQSDVHEISEEISAIKEANDQLKTETDNAEKYNKQTEPKKTKEIENKSKEEFQQVEHKEQLEQNDELKLEVEQKQDNKVITSETQEIKNINEDAETLQHNQAKTEQSVATLDQENFLEKERVELEKERIESGEFENKRNEGETEHRDEDQDNKAKEKTEKVQLSEEEKATHEAKKKQKEKAEQIGKEQFEAEKLESEQVTTKNQPEDEDHAKMEKEQTKKKKLSKKKKSEEEDKVKSESENKQEQNAAKLEDKQIEAEKLEKEQCGAEKRDNEQVEVEKQQQVDESQAKMEKEQADKKKLAKKKKNREKDNDNLEAEKKHKHEPEKLEKEQIEAEKQRSEAEKLEDERSKAEKKEQDRIKTEELEKDRLEVEKLEEQHLVAEKHEKELIEPEEREKDRVEAEKLEKEQNEAEKKEQERVETAELERKQLEAGKLEKERLDAEQLEMELIEAEKRSDAEKLEKERLEAEKEEHKRIKAEELEKKRLEAEKKEQERAEAEDLEKKQLKVEKEEQERIKTEELEKERLEAEKLEKERLDAENLETERLKAEKLEKEQLEAEKKEQERIKAEEVEKKRLENEKKEQERIKAEELEKKRLEDEKKEQERIKAEELEKKRLEDEKKEQERIEAEKLEKKRLKTEKKEQERIKAEELEKKRLEDEKKEQERIEAEELEKKRLEAEKKEQERIKAEELEQKRLEDEKKEQEWIEAEELEKKRLEAEKKEQERIKAEDLEQKRLEEEKKEQERIEAKKLEKKRLAAEKKEQERLKAEELEKKRLEDEKKEQERIETEKLEKKRLEAEKKEQERIQAEELEKKRLEEEKKEQERIEAEKLEKKRLEAEKKEQELIKAEELEKKRLEAEKKEQERIEAEELENKRLEAEKKEQERIKAEVLEKKRLEDDKKEQERIKAEEFEKKRLEAEKKERIEAEELEKKRLEDEKKEQELIKAEELEKKRLEDEKKEQERIKAEELEKKRLEAENLEKEHLDAEKLEKEHIEAKKRETDRVDAEKLEKEQVEAEKLEKERKKTKKLEKEQKAAKKLEKEKIEAEKLKDERAEAEKLEKERIDDETERVEEEKMNKERIEAEIRDKSEKEKQESNSKNKIEEEEKAKVEAERINKEKSDKKRLETEEQDKKTHEETEKKKLTKKKKKGDEDKIKSESNIKLNDEKDRAEKMQTEDKITQELELLEDQRTVKEKEEEIKHNTRNQEESKDKPNEENLLLEKNESDKLEKEQELEQKRREEKMVQDEKTKEEELTKKQKEEADKLKKAKTKKRKEDEEKAKKETETKQEKEAKLEKEKAKLEQQNKDKEESEKREKENIEAELKKKEEAKIKEQEKDQLEAEKKLQKDERLKKEIETEKLEKEKKAAEKKRKQEEKLKQEQKEKDLKEKDEADIKRKDDERLKEKEKQEAKEKEEYLKQEENEKRDREKKRTDRREKEKQEEKIREDEEKAKLEKKKLTKKKREEEEARLKAEAEESEKARKEAARKKKEEEKLRIIKEQEQYEKREQEIRERDKKIREERRREIEKDLNETKQKTSSTSEDDSFRESKSKRKQNGDLPANRGTEGEEHYMREYHYEPSRQKTDERPKFVDHNHRDYTLEFTRPSGYREKTFEPERFSERESLGRSATIYKAQTIILDSQLRSSAPPQPDRSESARRTEQLYDRSDSERRVERHRSKALSEARSLVSEKRAGLSRDHKRKPVFSTFLTDRTAVEGSRVKLTCSVLSSSDPKITWYKNGVLLDNKLKYKTKFMDGLITLEVLNAVVSDSAEYSCTVENENGSVNSSANLKVYPSFEASPIPPTFTRSIRDTYHLAENELVLECRIRGQPLPTITWLKDDKPVSTNERYQAYYLADGVCRLAISSPTPDDSGKYTCKAENSVWTNQITHVVSFTGKESRLSPNVATRERSHFNRQALESRRPHFTNVLSDYKVAKGGTIGLQVEIRGCPTRVEWLREGCSVTEVYRNARTFVEQGLYTLALSDVTEKESGMYTCRAWSTHGNVDMNAAITVVTNELEGKPAVIAGRPEKDILISVGEDVNISFRVQGEPKPKVVFMKGIRDITTNQRVCKMTSDDYVKFTLKRSVVSDAGTYCILARNAYGCDRAFVTVVVRQRASSENLISDWTYPLDDSSISVAERKYKSVPDRIPGEPSVVDGGNNWVSLAWPKADPRDTAPVLAYKIESWLLGKEGGARWTELGITPLNSFDAFNLKQGEEYHFRVTPRNRYGWGESVQTSAPVGIGLAGDRPEFVDILPGQLKVLAGATANLSCSVKGKPLPEIVWMKNGHEIEEESRMTTLYNGQDCSLTIRDVSIEDEARYSCEASNVHGRASTYARVAVVTDRLIWEADAKLKRERSQDAEGDYPPQFTMRLRDRRVQATYPVRLTCQVVGNPPPTLTWFKDGDTLVFDSRRNTYQDEHFHTLEIAPTNLEDGGVYEAMARNSSGAVSCRCSLVVDKGIRAYVAPEFCCGLEPLYRLSEGEELRISAVVEAYPSVGVTWYRDGVRLRPSRRAIMTLDRDGQIELALAFVTYRDAGVYTCTASNEVGRASTSGKVIVVEGTQPREKRTPPVVINAPDELYSKEPMFVRKPRSSEAREGDTVIIACEVIGDPKPDVYWLRDFLKPDYYRDASHFKRVGDGPEYRFEIPHAKLDYTGAYSVVARNVHGEAKAIISLQIKAKDPSSTDDSHNIRYGRVEVIPRFERELTDLLSYDGDAIEFECRVTGNPEPDIRWFHYNELIHDCPDFESSFDDGAARLKIKQVTGEDEGTYSCEASNVLGKTKSSACLVVYPPGEPNTLSQRLRRPPALLSAASTPRSTPRSTPARSVSRTPGPDTSRHCSPSRQMAPSFYTYPFNKVVEEGESVTFKCAVKGQPAPWATWDKDGIIITPSARFTVREKDELLRILEIEQVTIEDVGVYRITIENEFGRAEASARLEVITQKGKFYAGVRAYSASPRKSLSYRRYPSVPRQD